MKYSVFSIQYSVFLAMALMALVAGCVSKSKSQEEARKAFIAGQQEALRHMQQNQTPIVTFIGPVANPTIPWTQDLTLAQALISASYTGRSDPAEILLIRRGVAQRVDLKKLLAGEEIRLQPGDIVQVR